MIFPPDFCEMWGVCLAKKKKLRKNVTGWERRRVLGRGLNLWGGFLVLPPRRDGRTDRQWWVETQEEWTQRQRGAPKEVTAPPRAQAPSERHTFRSLSFLPWRHRYWQALSNEPVWSRDTAQCLSCGKTEQQHYYLLLLSVWWSVTEVGLLSVWVFPVSLQCSAWHVVRAQWGAGLMEMLTSSSIRCTKPNKMDPEEKLGVL